MKKRILLLFAVIVVLALTGCCGSEPVVSITETVTQTITTPEPAFPTETEPEPAKPPHSEFYIPGVEVDSVIRFFNEVCLDAEMIHSGNPRVLQKWVSPIRYELFGNYTAEDLAAFSAFTQWLNTVEGFPGILEAQSPEQTNLRIHFCTRPELVTIMGNGFSGLDGAVTFWYEDDEIYNAVICYRTDINQYTRNSVILEELYNGLGPVQDTDLRPDSILYSGFSEPQQLTKMDELLLKLLYHPQLTCGMDAESCEAVIRQLYY